MVEEDECADGLGEEALLLEMQQQQAGLQGDAAPATGARRSESSSATLPTNKPRL